jgi:putative phage-type endonuclease
MPLTQEQLLKRRDHLGASDMAAVLGLDPFRSPYDVMCDKRGLLEDKASTDWQEAGNLLEPAILNWARAHIGELIVPQDAWKDPKGSCLAANPDGILVSNGSPVEAKSHLTYTDEHWGDPGSDDVPQRVIVQATVQMMCSPAQSDACHVVALLSARLFVPFVVHYNQTLADWIRKAADEFWRLRDLGQMPEGVPSPEIVKRIKREPASVAKVSKEVFLAAKEARQEALDADKRKEAAMAKLFAEMGTAEAAVCEAGMMTYLEQTRASYVVKESTFRVARFKK